VITLTAAVGSIAWSLLTLIGLPTGHNWTRKAMRARVLSTREFKRYETAMNHILQLSQGTVYAPHHVFAVKSAEERAWTVGTTMYLTSQALKGSHLVPLVAREVYMINSVNGSLILGLRRLILPHIYYLSFLTYHLAPGNFTFSIANAAAGKPTGLIVRITSLLIAMAGGGVGLFFTSPLWIKYWHKEMYKADAFVKSIGLKHPFIDYLEKYEHLDIAVPYFFDPLPDAELRIDALLA
jgi:hypothetical protein